MNPEMRNLFIKSLKLSIASFLTIVLFGAILIWQVILNRWIYASGGEASHMLLESLTIIFPSVLGTLPFFLIPFIALFFSFYLFLKTRKSWYIYIIPILGLLLSVIIFIVIGLMSGGAGGFFLILYVFGFGTALLVPVLITQLIIHLIYNKYGEWVMLVPLISVIILSVLIISFIISPPMTPVQLNETKTKLNRLKAEDTPIDVLIDVCYEFGKTKERDDCLHSVQKDADDPQFCQKVKFVTDQAKRYCLIEQTIDFGDPEDCLKLSEGKWTCLKDMAIAKNTLEPCTVGTQSDFNICAVYPTIKELTTPGICRNYSEYLNGYEQLDTCIQINAVSTGDINECGHIEILHLLEQCIKGVVKKTGKQEDCDKGLIFHRNYYQKEYGDLYHFGITHFASECAELLVPRNYTFTDCMDIKGKNSCRLICEDRNQVCQEECEYEGAYVASIGYEDSDCTIKKYNQDCNYLLATPFVKCCCG